MPQSLIKTTNLSIQGISATQNNKTTLTVHYNFKHESTKCLKFRLASQIGFWGGGCRICATCSEAEHKSPRLMLLIARLPKRHPSIWMNEMSMCSSLYLLARCCLQPCLQYNKYSLLLLSLKEDGFSLWIFSHPPLTCGWMDGWIDESTPPHLFVTEFFCVCGFFGGFFGRVLP